MKSKYYEMHKDFLSLCSGEGIRLIPGRAVYLEARDHNRLRAEKTFFLMQEDFKKAEMLLETGLGVNYSITKAPEKAAYRWIRLERKDILATSMENLFKYPKAGVHPRFVIKEIKEAEESYMILQNKKEKQIPKEMLDNLKALEYAEGSVFAPEDAAGFFNLVYDMKKPLETRVAGYEIFDEDVDAMQLIEEAKRRGILSEEQKGRFRAFETWKKEIEKPAVKSYYAYQNELLALKLHDED